MQRCLNQIGVEQIRDLVCPDGLDGHYKIDRLALTRDAILVIAYKPYVGNIYCAERIAEWTQVIGRKVSSLKTRCLNWKTSSPRSNCAGQRTVAGLPVLQSQRRIPQGPSRVGAATRQHPRAVSARPDQPVKQEVRAAWEHLKWQQPNAASAARSALKLEMSRRRPRMSGCIDEADSSCLPLL